MAALSSRQQPIPNGLVSRSLYARYLFITSRPRINADNETSLMLVIAFSEWQNPKKKKKSLFRPIVSAWREFVEEGRYKAEQE